MILLFGRRNKLASHNLLSLLYKTILLKLPSYLPASHAINEQIGTLITKYACICISICMQVCIQKYLRSCTHAYSLVSILENLECTLMSIFIGKYDLNNRETLHVESYKKETEWENYDNDTTDKPKMDCLIF